MTTYDANALETKSQAVRLEVAAATRKVRLVVTEEVTYHLDVEIAADMEGEDLDDWAAEYVVQNLHPIDHFVSVDERDISIEDL